MNTELRYKLLDKNQLIISIDRLTRFKYTSDKYLRVFKDIITSNLIQPKFSKKDLDCMEYIQLKEIAENIINSSMGKIQSNYSINKKLEKIENAYFKLDKETQNLLKNKINYDAFLELIKDKKDLPCNLKRIQNFSKYPIIKKIVITEGITEEILLPELAKIYKKDFFKNGVYLISAGGKNQVVKIFYQLVEQLKLPVFILLDNDAKSNFEELKPKLRKKDEVYIIKSGEFEDILPKFLIKRALNKRFKNFYKFTIKEIKTEGRMTKKLEELLREKGGFKKSEFAGLVAKNIKNKKDLSNEITEILDKILDL